ncbi:isopentenyl diphosphate isomerase/L-lactate dehydrogenase-like FMN-dependent dehydrogenase [Altererythrobacter atlanticus]|uniref:(S)-mandelate dehydrogenase n=1 Tax=Croceibacterium atlanticum TaxID=1267766 RepID=A0A0F7KQP9_9SPHN|nr:alpha-hydroxy acid oxidase [Croceibacterium atlanticum]AKH41497.1 (S)-mandelate dehydrogenase [Croceibacterium atlanticum]MBB5732959.1 isopentenyl diphosphate isomerase/L-lactate dehydrogenase-like FMN-dependent dehydrogenase [Croceibacterium atlanticum]
MAGDLACYNIADLRERARRRLPKGIWEYLERGVEDETGMARNRASFDAITFRPRILRNVEKVDPDTSIFGRETPLPMALAPTGAAGLLWYRGDLALARAAAKAGLPFTISSASTMDLEDIAKAGGRLWFQLYMWEDRSLSHAVVDRAWAAGCEALFVTLDMAVPPNREYIHRSGFGTPFRLNARNTLDVLAHPRWLAGTMGRYALDGGVPSQANLPDRLRSRITKGAPPGALFKQDNLDWDGIAELRSRWPGKLVLKGMLHPADAERALAIGADGIVVSNHGARALDSSVAAIDALPDIVSAVGGKMTIFLDSGIRRGSDIVKAVERGADAVLVGRAPLYGLSAAGEAGVLRALDLLGSETRRSMALLGARNIDELRTLDLM